MQVVRVLVQYKLFNSSDYFAIVLIDRTQQL